jgi:hypothetical protein
VLFEQQSAELSAPHIVGGSIRTVFFGFHPRAVLAAAAIA